MPYATQAGMTVRFGEQELIQRTDRTKPRQNVIDSAVLAAAMTRADGLVDDYLRTRYVVPLSPVPAQIQHAAESIARRYLYDDGVTEAVKSLYDEAIAYLLNVQSGKARLDSATAAPSTSAGVVGTAQFTSGRNDFACPY